MNRFQSTKLFASLFIVATLSFRSFELGSAAPTTKTLTPDFNLYFVSQTLSLDGNKGSFDGKVELLQDLQLKDRKNPHISPDFETYLPNFPFHDALLRLVTETGKILSVQTMTTAFVGIKRVDLYGDNRPAFVVTSDFRIGHATIYPFDVGLIISFFEISRMRLVPLQVFSTDGSEAYAKIISSGYGAWKIVPAGSGRGSDVLHVMSDFKEGHDYWEYKQRGEDPPYVITYNRMSHDGSRWIWRTRIVDGLWESAEFPNTELFP